MFFVILLYALFAATFTIGKTGLEYSQPLFFVGSRMFLAGVLLLSYQYVFKREQFLLRKADLGRVLKLAVFAIYLTNILEFWGLKYLTSFKTCFIYSLSPFASALLAYWMLGDRITKKQWLGLFVGCIGFLPILINETSTEELTGHIWFLSWAEIAVIGAALASVYGWVLLKQLVNENGYSPFMANGLSMLIGGSIALVHSSFTESWNPIPVTELSPFIDCMLLLILISNCICYNLYGYLLKQYSATFVSFAGFITPLFTALFGWFYLGEVVTWPFYVSAVVVFAGLFLFNQDELKETFPLAEKQAV
jgi:drug/metabolite transporter (DMT)-like permease